MKLKIKFTFLIIFLLMTFCSNSFAAENTGNLIVKNQKPVSPIIIKNSEEIPDFAKQNTDSCNTPIIITGEKIRDLQFMSSIKTLSSLTIVNCPNLYDLSGLQHLNHVTGNLNIINCPGLWGLRDLSHLEKVDGNLFLQSLNIKDFRGFDNLSKIGGNLDIYDNNNLLSLMGFYTLQTIGGSLDIENCPSIKEIIGMRKLERINKELYLVNCPIAKIFLYQDPPFINGFWIENTSIKNLDFAKNSTTFEGDLTIRNCPITSLAALKNLHEVKRRIFLDNLQINDLSGLESLENAGSIYINNLPNLENIKGLKNLKSITGFERFENDLSLPQEVSKLDTMNLQTYHSTKVLTHPESLTKQISITNCPLIKDYRPLKEVFEIPYNTVELLAENNHTNYTKNGFISKFIYKKRSKVLPQFDKHFMTCHAGDTFWVRADKFSTINNKLCTWSSDNTSVAEVNENGIVKTKKPGTTIIRAIVSNKKEQLQTDTCHLVVMPGKDTLFVNGFRHLEKVEQMGFIKLNGSLVVYGDNIHTLEGLSTLKEADNLILFNCTNLHSLSGLEKLERLSQSFIIKDCGIKSTEQLTNLKQIDGSFIIDSTDIENIDDLNNLQSIGVNLIIRKNNFLANISGLDGLNYVGNNVKVENCNTLENINGINNLLIINCLKIANNNLSMIRGFQNLSAIKGNLSIIGNNNFKVNSGLIHLKKIEGDLDISGNFSLTNLHGLDSLSSIKGNCILSNNFSLPNMEGLNSLKKIGKSFKCDENFCLINCKGLDALDSINGDFEISNNKRLRNLEGFNNLKNIKGNIFISNNFYLNNIAGLNKITEIKNLSITDNAYLSNFSGLSQVKTINGNLIISGNTNLNNLQGFNELELINGSLTIDRNNNLPNFRGLDSIRQVNDLNILNNKSLVSLEGLNKLDTINENFDIENNNSLKNFSGLNQLRRIWGNFYCINNKNLENLSGLQNLQYVGNNFEIDKNSSLKNLEGLENITNLHSLEIEDNPKLQDFQGLNNLTVINKNLSICRNFSITSFEGFNKLAQINEFFDILSCSKLTSLNGLENLTKVGFIRVWSDFSLTNCDALKNLTYSEEIEPRPHIELIPEKKFEFNKSKIEINDKQSDSGSITDVSIYEKRDRFDKDNVKANSSIHLSLEYNKEGLKIMYNSLKQILDKANSLTQTDQNCIVKNKEENVEPMDKNEQELLNNEDNSKSKISFYKAIYPARIDFKNCPQLYDFCVFKNLLSKRGNKTRFTADHNGHNPSKHDIINNRCFK